MKIFRVISALLLVALMTSIFIFSLQNAEKSGTTSSNFTKKVISVVYPDFKNMEKKEQQKIITDFSFPIRKTAHFTLYFCLGILSFATVITYRKFTLHARYVIAFGISALYAVSDEIHQYFVPGRSCQISDMLLDSCAALLAISLMMYIFKRIKKFNYLFK